MFAFQRFGISHVRATDQVEPAAGIVSSAARSPGRPVVRAGPDARRPISMQRKSAL